LHQNYPNPFNASTEIRYQIPEDGHVTLKIFNTLGQELRILLDVHQKAGEYGVLWDGRDARGREVASGLYFCRLRAGEFGKTIKMVLVR
ncbi:T9SS type A sorting domain-containing protein, partial [bacterium]|nr:T9SS type A sorting domain-containing protein [bacterium]